MNRVLVHSDKNERIKEEGFIPELTRGGFTLPKKKKKKKKKKKTLVNTQVTEGRKSLIQVPELRVSTGSQRGGDSLRRGIEKSGSSTVSKESERTGGWNDTPPRTGL